MEQTFFGFKPKDRVKLHEVLFDLVWAGEGRWDLETVYSMPIPMRRFWIKRLNEKNAKTEEAPSPPELPKFPGATKPGK